MAGYEYDELFRFGVVESFDMGVVSSEKAMADADLAFGSIEDALDCECEDVETSIWIVDEVDADDDTVHQIAYVSVDGYAIDEDSADRAEESLTKAIIAQAKDNRLVRC